MFWATMALIVKVALGGWLVLVALAIAWNVATGRIHLSGIVRARNDTAFGFHRVQLVVVTLVFAVGYVATALSRDPGAGMPDISTPLLVALLGSHAVYLGGKAMG